MALTKTFRRSGLLVLAGVVLLAAGGAGLPGGLWTPAGVLLVVVAGPVFAASAFRHLMRGLLWRVGSRLVVSYLLLVSPFLFLAVVAYAGIWLVAAQVAGQRLERALDARRDALQKTARLLADRFEQAPTAAARRAAFDELAGSVRTFGDAGYDYDSAGGREESWETPDGVSLLPRAWLPSIPTLLIGHDGRRDFFAAIERRRSGILVLTLRTGARFRAALERDLGMEIDIRRARPAAAAPPESPPRATLSFGEERVDLERTEGSLGGAADSALPSAAPPAGSGPVFGRWILFPVALAIDHVDWTTGRPLPEERVILLLKSSVAAEADHLFGEIRVGRSATRSADVALAVMKVLGGTALAVFLIATLIAAVLVLRISRATRRLSQGVAEIEKGNFAHRVALAGNDQLSRLVSGFNEMASHLETSVSERAEKQALEHELQVARDLQRRLLPPADFACPGVEIAIDFHPAAAIGGDFYDLVASPPGALTVVLADVSGHGLPTGIVMASAKASLTALVRAGATGENLLSSLDAEITRTTDSRTFVTMAYLQLLLAERRVLYTNAGHVYPYRITPAGAVSALVNPARPLGLGLPVRFRTVEAPLEAGDLWVLLSDGIVEATRAGGDDEFGFPRLEAALRGTAGGTAVAARDRVLSAWRDFTGGDEPVDDRTLIVLRIGSSPTDG